MITKQQLKVCLALMCLVFALLYLNRSYMSMEQQLHFSELRDMLDFVPQTPGFTCEDLFKDTPARAYNMTPLYYRHQQEYWNLKQTRGGKFPEEEYRALHYAVGKKFVRNVCETGFNAGASSFYHLTASDQTVVHSFELGGELYRKHVADWLGEKFPSRFNIHIGDSVKTVPEFIRQNPDFRCDFMYVDGGHVYSVAKEDVINFSKMANLKHNYIAFDDYPPGWEQFGKAWEESISNGIIKEIMRCSYKSFPGSPRGFVVGVVVKHPNP